MLARGILIVACLTACSSTQESPDASVPAAEVSPIGSRSADPQQSSGAAPEAPLAPGWFGRVVAEAVNVRTDPTVAASPVAIPVPDALPLEAALGTRTATDRVYVLDGPVEADGFTWYLVAPLSGGHEVAPQFAGWIADGDAEDAWLVPDDAPCPAHPLQLEDLTLASSTWAMRIACAGNEPLTLTGWFPEIPPDVAATGECYAEPAFLVCPGPQDIRTIEMTFYDDRQLNRLDFAVDPAAGVALPERGQWIEVIGRFNHPASVQCPASLGLGPGVGVALCRAGFVVHAARPAP